MTAVAALESGAVTRRDGPNALVVAAYVGGTALLVASLALLAAFYNLRDAADRWPARGVDFDEYLSVMLTVTLLMSAAILGWGAWAATHNNRRQALAAMAITVGLGLAFLNLAWYTGSHAGFGPSSHSFGGVVIASLAVGSAAVVIGIAALAVALIRTQLRAEEPSVVGAAARFWFFVVAAWIVSPVALYGLMSPK